MIEIYAQPNYCAQSVDLFIFDQKHQHRLQLTDFREAKNEPGITPTASIQLREVEAQKLMDRLWQCGVRPSAPEPSLLAAKDEHLQDMRRLVFAGYTP